MNYAEEIKSSPVVLVEFYASWCPHCQKMMPIIEKIKEKLQGKVNVFQYDVDQNQELSDKEKISTIPTFIIYKDGKSVWSESGEMEEQALLDKIQSYLG